MTRYALWAVASAILLATITAAGCLRGTRGAPETADPRAAFASLLPDAPILSEPVTPLPEAIPLDARRVALGRRLFHDVRLSHDDTIACASCHALDKGGTDQAARSTGIGGAKGGINSPSVLNSGLNFVQFWNGRAETLEDQVEGPTHHPKEMGSNWKEIQGKLRADEGYVREFAAVYPDGIQPAHIKDAIATFERSLVTPHSRFDRYLRGNAAALSEQEKRGYRLFNDYGCVSCHQGVNLGSNLYQRFGVMADYFADRGGEVTEDDLGRFGVTKEERDRHVFRVPSLRNIALTAPYFHDGSAATLPQAVGVMAKYQLGRFMEPDEVISIVSFLEALTGDQHPVSPQGGRGSR